MKALTIWQPWASLIIAGAKPYEFRGWRAPRSIIGQRVVIHAAAKKIDRDEASMLWQILTHRDQDDDSRVMAAETCLRPDIALPILGRAWMPYREPLPMACGLGTAVIGEPRNGLDIAAEFGAPRANDSDRDEHANWGWPMLEIEPWPEPIPMRGMQGLWNWPSPADLIMEANVFGKMLLHVVEPGTVKTCPETGIEMTIDDTGAVVDHRSGVIWLTQRHYDLLKELAAPAPTGGAG